MKQVWEGKEPVHNLDLRMAPRHMHMSKCVRVCSADVCHLLRVTYLSIKPNKNLAPSSEGPAVSGLSHSFCLANTSLLELDMFYLHNHGKFLAARNHAVTLTVITLTFTPVKSTLETAARANLKS